MSKPVALILGYGANVGTAVAKKFSSNGYSVAISARKLTDGKTAEGYFAVKADLSDTAAIPSIFEKVRKELGNPNVVIYNAATFTAPSGDNLFSIPLEALERDHRTNTLSPFIAAQQAVHGFEKLPSDIRKTYIFTGNIQNVKVLPIPALTTAGMGKSATAHWVGIAALTLKDKGYNFYYADERNDQGGHVGNKVGGEAHAQFYLDLASGKSDAPYEATFVKGKGYVDFSK